MTTILRLLHFLRPLGGWVLASVLLSTGTILANIGLLGTSAFLIATAASHPSIAELSVAIVGVRFFGIARSVLRYLERLASHSANFRLLAGLRAWFFQRLEPLAPAGLVDQRGGDLLSRVVADIEGLEDFYVRAVAPPLTALLVILGMGLVLGIRYPQVGAALVLGLMLSGVGVPWLAHQLGRRPGQQWVTARAESSGIWVDLIQGLPDLAAFGQEEEYSNRLRIANHHARQAQEKMAQRSGLVSAASSLVTHLTLLAVLFIAIPLVRAGGMDGVTLAVVTLVTLASFEATQPLGAASQRLQAALTSAGRLFEITGQEPLVCEPEHPAYPPAGCSIQFHSVTFGYRPDSAPVLVNFSLDLPPGKRVGLVGPSGAGKTTLFSLLLRFWDPDEGQILLDGRPLCQYASRDLRRQFAVIGQNPFVFNGTLRANLLLAQPQALPEDLERALRQARLWEWAQALPQGLDTWIGERGTQISGGERQRLAIARALLQDAPTWLLDEPTTHLDEQARHEIANTLWETAQGRSLIWITHDLRELARMDEVLVLQEGRVRERGAPQQLSEMEGWFNRWKNVRPV